MGLNRANVFETTRWSVIYRAAEGCSKTRPEAWTYLSEKYWHPIYCFIRRSGYSREQAEDFTQSFFAHLMDSDILPQATPEKGRFRHYLLACVRGFVSNELSRQKAAKRGGGRAHLSLDFDEAENYYICASPSLSADRLFDRRWALDMIARSVALLGEEQSTGKYADRFHVLGAFLVGNDNGRIKDAADRLGISEEAARVSLHRYRKRLGEIIRDEIAETLADETMVRQELEYLMQAIEN